MSRRLEFLVELTLGLTDQPGMFLTPTGVHVGNGPGMPGGWIASDQRWDYRRKPGFGRVDFPPFAAEKRTALPIGHTGATGVK
jgi:hypothetical protein